MELTNEKEMDHSEDLDLQEVEESNIMNVEIAIEINLKQDSTH